MTSKSNRISGDLRAGVAEKLSQSQNENMKYKCLFCDAPTNYISPFAGPLCYEHYAAEQQRQAKQRRPWIPWVTK